MHQAVAALLLPPHLHEAVHLDGRSTHAVRRSGHYELLRHHVHHFEHLPMHARQLLLAVVGRRAQRNLHRSAGWAVRAVCRHHLSQHLPSGVPAVVYTEPSRQTRTESGSGRHVYRGDSVSACLDCLSSAKCNGRY